MILQITRRLKQIVHHRVGEISPCQVDFFLEKMFQVDLDVFLMRAQDNHPATRVHQCQVSLQTRWIILNQQINATNALIDFSGQICIIVIEYL